MFKILNCMVFDPSGNQVFSGTLDLNQPGIPDGEYYVLTDTAVGKSPEQPPSLTFIGNWYITKLTVNNGVAERYNYDNWHNHLQGPLD